MSSSSERAATAAPSASGSAAASAPPGASAASAPTGRTAAAHPPLRGANAADGAAAYELPELVAAGPAAAEADGGGGGAADAAAAREAELEAARAEAYAAGVEAGRSEVARAAEAVAAAARELDAERDRAAERAEPAAAELALLIAEKVVGAALEVRPELVVEVARGALRRLAEPQETVVLVNPEDAEIVRAALDDLTGELGAPLTVRAERRVTRGGCALRTQLGEVDAGIAEQLDRARAVVEGELGG